MEHCFFSIPGLAARRTHLLTGVLIGSLAGLMLASSGRADSLQSAVSHTIETNPEILISINQLRASEERVTIEKAAYLPKLGISGRVGWQRKDGKLKSGHYKTTDRVGETTIALKQMLFDGFSTSHRLKGARMDSHSRSLLMKARAETVALKVAEVYLRVIRSEQVVELARENLAVHDEIYNQIFQRTDSGLSRSSDLEQIRSRRARASSNLIVAINTLSDSRSEFLGIVNRKPNALIMPHLSDDLLPGTLEKALSMAGKINPMIQASSYQIKTYEAQAEATKSSFLPKLGIEVGQTWNDVDSDLATSDGRTDSLSAMLNFSYNIYNGGADKARRREAAWRVEEARASRDLDYRNISRDLRRAWDAYIYLNGQVKYLEEHITASQKVAQAYQQQFQLGKRSLLDLLDTENELFHSQKDFIQTVHDEIHTRFRILHSTGQLLTSMNIDLPTVLRPEVSLRAALLGDL